MMEEEDMSPEEAREECRRALEEIRLEVRRHVADHYEPMRVVAHGGSDT